MPRFVYGDHVGNAWWRERDDPNGWDVEREDVRDDPRSPDFERFLDVDEPRIDSEFDEREEATR